MFDIESYLGNVLIVSGIIHHLELYSDQPVWVSSNFLIYIIPVEHSVKITRLDGALVAIGCYTVDADNYDGHKQKIKLIAEAVLKVKRI